MIDRITHWYHDTQLHLALGFLRPVDYYRGNPSERHETRRAFAQQWSAKLRPTQLRELMRHASLATTLSYYVGEDAEATADALWAAVGNTLGNTRHGEKSKGNKQRAKHPRKQR